MSLREKYKTINLIQNEQGHWEIEERPQQESGIIHNEPLFIHVNFPNKEIIAIDEKENITPTIGMIGMGESSKKELIEILQTIATEEGHRRIVVVGANHPTILERKEATLGDFANMCIEEIRQDIFLITNTLEKREDRELKIEEHKIYNQKQAKYYHKFHNQKPRGPQGQYAKRGRK